MFLEERKTMDMEKILELERQMKVLETDTKEYATLRDELTRVIKMEKARVRAAVRQMCECGGVTSEWKSAREKHERSKRHQKWNLQKWM